MGEDPRRLARNEALFRVVNSEIAKLGEQLGGGDAESFQFVCECADAGCDTAIHVTLPAFRAVRAHSDRFLVAKGHADPSIERIVEETAAYDVVEKTGVAGDVARATDV